MSHRNTFEDVRNQILFFLIILKDVKICLITTTQKCTATQSYNEVDIKFKAAIYEFICLFTQHKIKTIHHPALFGSRANKQQ